MYTDVFTCTTANNYTGVTGVMSCINQAVPVFTPFILVSIWVVVVLGTYFTQQRLRGYGDFFGSFAVGSIFVAILSVIAYMVNPPIISKIPVFVAILMGFIGMVILFANNER